MAFRARTLSGGSTVYDAEAKRMSKISHLKGRRGHQISGKGHIFFNRNEKGETSAGHS